MIKKLVSGIIILLAVTFSTGLAEEIKIAVGGGFETVHSFRDRDIQYISLSELANSLGGTVAWEIVGHTVTYADAGHRFEFLIGAPWVNVNDTTYNLTHPAVYRDGQLYVPMSTFLPLLDRATSQHISWAPDEETVRVESGYFNVTDLSIENKANGLLIEIYLTSPLSYEIFITEGNWLNVSLREATINRNRVLSRRDNRYMYDLKVHQIENRTGQISMRLRRSTTDWSHTLERNPTRIQILTPLRRTSFAFILHVLR